MSATEWEKFHKRGAVSFVVPIVVAAGLLGTLFGWLLSTWVVGSLAFALAGFVFAVFLWVGSEARYARELEKRKYPPEHWWREALFERASADARFLNDLWDWAESGGTDRTRDVVRGVAEYVGDLKKQADKIESWLSEQFAHLAAEVGRRPRPAARITTRPYKRFKRTFETITVEPAREVGEVSRNLIVCIDGTYNDPDSRTNVHHLFKLLEPDGQVLMYHAGVGLRKNLGVAASFLMTPTSRLVLGGFGGRGAARIRKRAYLTLAAHYRPEDRIFIFGFSRGAAIARTLANMLEKHGLQQQVTAVFKMTNPKLQLGDLYSLDGLKEVTTENNERIEALGVWDTVASFGIPGTRTNLFKNLTVSSIVDKAYHLVAVDERRKAFRPSLMQRDDRVEEIWFPGVHTSVGGGYTIELDERNEASKKKRLLDRHLSDIALRFMMNRAAEHGVRFVEGAFESLNNDVKGTLEANNPWYMGERDRAIYVQLGPKVPKLSEVHESGPEPKSILHASIFEKIATDPEYRPQSLVDWNNCGDDEGRRFVDQCFLRDDRE